MGRPVIDTNPVPEDRVRLVEGEGFSVEPVPGEDPPDPAE